MSEEITLILVYSEQGETTGVLVEPQNSLLVLNCNKESKLYSVRGRQIAHIILKGIKYWELSEPAQKIIAMATMVSRSKGNAVPVLNLNSSGEDIRLDVFPELDRDGETQTKEDKP